MPDERIDRLLGEFKFRRFLPHIKGKVLDLGCGIGLVCEKLHQKGFTVEGVDGSSERIRLASLRVPSVQFHCSLFEKFQPSSPVDTIILSNVLEHMQQPVQLLEKCHGWLNKGGVVITAVPNKSALHKRVGMAMGITEELSEADHHVGHVRTYDLPELEKQITQAGFRVKYSGGVCIKPLPNKMLESVPSEVLEGYFKISGAPELADLCSMVYTVGVKDE